MTLTLGKVRPGSTIYIPFATYDKDDGSSITQTGLAVTDIEIYKAGSVTQRSSDTGYTLLDTDGIDFDSLTGIHGFSIDLSSNADAGFYSAGSRYFVVVSSITVDSVTVSFVAATFEIGFEGAVLDTTIASLSSQTSFTLTAGPAEDDALNGCVVYIHDVASAVQGGFAVISDYTGSTKTVTLTAGVTFTAAATDNISIFPPANTRWLGGTAQTGRDIGTSVLLSSGTGTGQVSLSSGTVTAGAISAGAITAAAIATGAIDADAIAADAVAEIADGVWDEDATGHQATGTFGQAIGDPVADTNTIYGAVVTGATGATIAADIITIDDLLDTEVGALTTELAKVPKSDSNVTWNATALASIQSESNDALVAYDPPTKAELDSAVAPLALEATLATVDNLIDTEIATIITMLTGIVPVNGTIGATGNTTTALHLSGIAWADNGPNSMLLTIKDVSTGLFYSRWIEDFADTGDLATVATLPFTPEASVDLYWLTPVRADVTGGSGLDAAGVRAAIGLASANLDTQLGTIDTNVDDIETAVITNAAGVDIAADIIAIKAQTAAIEVDTAEIGAAGAGLTNINLPNQTMDIVGNITGNLSGSVGSVTGAVGSVTGAVGSVAAGGITASSIAADAIGASELAADAVAEIAAAISIPSAATIADAVWDEDATGHQTTGTFGQAIGDPGASTETLFKAIVTDPAGTNIAADVIAIKAETASILDDTDDIGVAGAGLTALATQASVNTIDDLLDTEISALTTAVADLPTNAELATALGTADDAVLAAIAALNNLSSSAAATAVLTTAMTESYNSDGSAPTLAQAVYLIMQRLTEFAISSTTVTIKKLDGSTTAATLTLDDATSPTSSTRAT